mmetsp:Transcript_28270/g.28558  ORF Transcript_28270/g.28558 Transcript_28270/m.28558 type:complete len:259 (+) Transcript_28270:344-1120(+)
MDPGVTTVDASKPRLTGSMHKFTEGYGYGARVETARNVAKPPLDRPQTVSDARHVPNVGKTHLHRLPQDLADKRSGDNRQYLTSGQYGKFNFHSPFQNTMDSLGVTTSSSDISAGSISSGRDMISRPQTQSRPRDLTQGTTRPQTQQSSGYHISNNNSPITSQRSQQSLSGSGNRNSENSKSKYGTSQISDFKNTYSINNNTFNSTNIDPLFGRKTLCDLNATTLQPTSRQEKLLHISTAQQAYDLSGSWTRALRTRK